MKKKLVFAILFLFLNSLCIAQTEIEPNNTTAQANPITLGNCITEAINAANDIDYFTFTPSKGGVLNVFVSNIPSALTSGLRITLYDNATSLTAQTIPLTGGVVAWTLKANQIYYVKVQGVSTTQTSTSNFNICFKLDLIDGSEYNGDPTTAKTVTKDTCFAEKIWGYDGYTTNFDVDYYKFIPTKGGVLNVAITSIPSTFSNGLRVTMYDNATSLTSQTIPLAGGVVAWTLKANQTYYIKIEAIGTTLKDSSAFNTCLKLDLIDGSEYNGDPTTAKTVTKDTCFKEKIWGYDGYTTNFDVDYYKFIPTKGGVLNVAITSIPGTFSNGLRVTMYDNATSLTSQTIPLAGGVVAWTLKANQTYYVKIEALGTTLSDSSAFNTCIHFDLVDKSEYNNSFITAANFTKDTCFAEKIWGYDGYTTNFDIDYYKVSMGSTNDTISVVLTNIPNGFINGLNVSIYDSLNTSTSLYYKTTSTSSATFLFPVTINHTYYVKIAATGTTAKDSTAFNTCISKKKNTTVPLKLLSFKVQKVNSQNFLTWETINEINTQKFIIEKSIDSRFFIELATINPKGISSTMNKYDFIDNTITNYGNFFYRLKIIDNDGTITYSNIIEIESNNADIKVNPNPAAKYIDINSKNIKTIQLIDSYGKVVFQTSINSNNQKINIEKYARGVYTLLSKSINNSIITHKIVIN